MRLSILTLSAVLFLNSACGDVEARPTTGVGYISLTSQRGSTSYGYALFMASRPANPGCTRSMIGECEVLECVDAVVVPLPPRHNAGVITVAGLSLDSGFAFSFVDAGCFHCPAYDSVGVLPELWNGGETLTFAATGATGANVPAFSGMTVKAPHPITVTAPACTDLPSPQPNCSVSRTADLTISWTGKAGTSVHAQLNSGRPNHLVSLSCRFDSSPGTIGAAAMAKLGKRDAGYSNHLSVLGSNQTKFSAGSYEITLEANNSPEFGTFVDTSN